MNGSALECVSVSFADRFVLHWTELLDTPLHCTLNGTTLISYLFDSVWKCMPIVVL